MRFDKTVRRTKSGWSDGGQSTSGVRWHQLKRIASFASSSHCLDHLAHVTGYRLETTDGYIVQAADIHQHAKSGNDNPRNGLALTHRVGAAFYATHWMFDAGLWTVIPKGDDLLIHVATGRFEESSPHARLLAQFHGQPLTFHGHTRLHPDLAHLAWHARHHRVQTCAPSHSAFAR